MKTLMMTPTDGFDDEAKRNGGLKGLMGQSETGGGASKAAPHLSCEKLREPQREKRK